MLKRYSCLVFIAALLGSCTGDGQFDPDPVVRLGDKPQITAPAAGTSFELKEADAADLLPAFTWTTAEFGFDAAVTYTLEMDVAGNNFADATAIGASNSLALDNVTVGKINNVLLGKGLPGETPVDVELRLSAKIHPEVPVVYSDPVTITITPYTVFVVYPQLQVPGSYQGWKPEENSTVIFSVKSNDKYEGYINFPSPNTEFKYTVGPSWSLNYGDTGADGTLDKDGDNIKAADAGVYKLNVDLIAKTHTYTKTDWGIIGSATPDQWNSDQNMTFDPVGNKWTIDLTLTQDEIKFRANDDWAINLGDTGANKSLEYGGDNIKVPAAGDYTVELILSGAVYTYKLIKK